MDTEHNQSEDTSDSNTERFQLDDGELMFDDTVYTYDEAEDGTEDGTEDEELVDRVI